MFKCVRTLLCLLVISSIGFAALSVLNGGERIRTYGDKAEGMIQQVVYKLADKADRIKEEVDGIRGKVKKWTGKGEDPGAGSPENAKKHKEKGKSENK
ncbi:MAG TPA: hypothetical protein VF790_05585 [Dissulfurispiraceae bacterium]